MESSESENESTVQNVESENVNSVTNGPTVTIDIATESQEQTKFDIVSSTMIASTIKSSDRSRIVSKDDIESIRGRALNLNSTDRKSTTSGIIYVTAPPSSQKPSKTFSDDLSDVSMDNESMDFHSSEHVVTTAQPSLIHDTECHSKVCHSIINRNFLIYLTFSEKNFHRNEFIRNSFY